MSRRLLVALARRAEGALFAATLAVWLPGLLLASVARLARRPDASPRLAELWFASLRRWRRFLLRGLSPVREAWWPALSFEPQRNVWRYVMMMEFFDLVNVASARRRVAEIPEQARVLVVKLAHIGDALHVFPSLRALSEHRPEWQLDVMMGPWCRPLEDHLPRGAKFLPYTPNLVLFSRGVREGRLGFFGEILFLWRLRRRRYALVFSTSVTGLVERCLIHAICPDFWLGAQCELALYPEYSSALTKPYTTRQYEAQRIADLLPLAGLPPLRAALAFQAPEPARQAAVRRLNALKRPIVVIAPGGGWPGKLWPAERFAHVADAVIERAGASVVIVGSAAERSLAQEMQRAMRHSAADWTGQTSVDDLAAVLAEADLLICNDSAPMHFAVAVGTPCLCLFGPTPRAQWGPPEGGPHRVLTAKTTCSDCHPFHPLSRCSRDRICMRSIAEETVIETALEMLSEPALRSEQLQRAKKLRE